MSVFTILGFRLKYANFRNQFRMEIADSLLTELY